MEKERTHHPELRTRGPSAGSARGVPLAYEEINRWSSPLLIQISLFPVDLSLTSGYDMTLNLLETKSSVKTSTRRHSIVGGTTASLPALYSCDPTTSSHSGAYDAQSKATAVMHRQEREDRGSKTRHHLHTGSQRLPHQADRPSTGLPRHNHQVLAYESFRWIIFHHRCLNAARGSRQHRRRQQWGREL